MAVSIESRKIANAGTNSEAFDAGNAIAGTFTIPAAFTGSSIQCQFSNNNINWTNIGNSINVTANSTYVIPDDVFKAAFGRLVSNNAEAAERTITLGLKRR